MGQYIDGIDSFDKAITLNPDDANAWYARGFGQFKTGEYADAIASYDKAIAINPDFTEARENREIALQRKE
jgi:tetratricopeptide (TPR) repeat protein